MAAVAVEPEQAQRFADEGAQLAATQQLPYHPVHAAPPPRAARRCMSFAFARTWGALPVGYDPAEHRLTVAVSDAQTAQRLQRIYALLMQPHQLAFCVATPAEIEAAIRVHLGADDAAAEAEWSRRPSALTMGRRRVAPPPEEAPTASVPDAPPAVEDAPPAGARAATDADRAVADEPPASSPDMESTRAFASALEALVEMALAGQAEDALRAVRARTRYAHLLGTRLGLMPRQVEDTDLTARWSALQEHVPELVRRLYCPGWLDAYTREACTDGEPENIEALIVRLVRAYEALRAEAPGGTPDVATARRALEQRVPLADDLDVVRETFLQVLADEDFLARLDRPTARVLVLDPREAAEGEIERALARESIVVTVPEPTQDVEDVLRAERFDAVVAYADDEAMVGLFREALDTAGHALPLLMLLDAPNPDLEARCLRAGADAVLARPLHADLLCATVLRLAAREVAPAGDGAPAAGEAQDGGVTGSLAEMSFTDVIQILSAGNRSMVLTLTAGDCAGEVYLREGAVVHAVCGATEGEDAFYELMRLTEGEFRTHAAQSFPEPTVHASTMSLLMEGARQMDEGA